MKTFEEFQFKVKHSSISASCEFIEYAKVLSNFFVEKAKHTSKDYIEMYLENEIPLDDDKYVYHIWFDNTYGWKIGKTRILIEKKGTSDIIESIQLEDLSQQSYCEKNIEYIEMFDKITDKLKSEIDEGRYKLDLY